MKLTKVFPIVALLLIVFLTGCNKKEEFAGVRPTVTSTDPISEGVSIALGSNISAIFSADMNPSTMTNANFIVMKGTEVVPGIVSYSDSTVVFNPTADLSASTLYNVKISTGAKDMSGISLIKDYTWSFTTGLTPDLAKPTVTLADPLNDATGVALNKAIVVTFSESMDPATIASLTYTLKQGTTPVAGIVSYTGVKATFTPSANLAYSKVYTATVTTGAKDLGGNALAANYVFSFTTVDAPDVALPMVNSTLPLTSATGVASNNTVSVTFSEPMTPSTINSNTFTVLNGTTPVAGTVIYSGNTATFTPAADLAANTTYTATVTTGAKDLAGNALAANLVWTFTTGAAPTVVTVNPLNLEAAVPLNKVLTAAFSIPMNLSTITSSSFTLKHGTTAVAGVVTYSGSTATFTPAVSLLTGTTYTATITTGAKSATGFALANNFTWSFSTGVASTLAVVNLGAAGNYVLLAKTAITNISTSAITGDLGLSPAATSYITGLSLTNATGYATSAQVTGQIFAADMAAPTGINLTTAVENMITAYNDAAGRPTPDFVELGTGNLGGKTLTPGLYKFTTNVTLPSNVTISGGANDVWIFQISQDLLMSNGVQLNLIGGAQAKNIFWQVAGQATFGTTSHFEGIILSMTGITFQTGASFKGRALAQTAVVLDGNAIVLP
jgi:hypothetical protein